MKYNPKLLFTFTKYSRASEVLIELDQKSLSRNRKAQLQFRFRHSRV